MLTRVKTKAELAAMRVSGQMLANVLQHLKPQVKPGISSAHLADLAAKELKRLGGQPAFLGYQGFPSVLCVSFNDEVVHGIPSAQRIIADGDLVSLDFGVSYKGMITDGAISLVVGNAPKSAQQLVQTTERALMVGIEAVKNGVHIGDIGHAVQSVLDVQHYGIVRDLVGHGVGHELHEDPNIPNYGYPGMGPTVKSGMTIAIEPMATLGDHQVYVDQDGWTIKTRDGSLAAHFEHTVLVDDRGAEILTHTQP